MAHLYPLCRELGHCTCIWFKQIYVTSLYLFLYIFCFIHYVSRFSLLVSSNIRGISIDIHFFSEILCWKNSSFRCLLYWSAQLISWHRSRVSNTGLLHWRIYCVQRSETMNAFCQDTPTHSCNYAISRLCDGYCIRTWWKAVITHHNLNKTNSSLIAWSNAWIQQLSLSHWSYPLTPSSGNPVPPWLDACLSARWQCKQVTH